VTGNSRKARGAKTQALVAAYLRERGWIYATDAGAGRTGNDILNVPFRCEVKARAGFDPVAALKQAATGSGDGTAFAVMRMNGQGEASVGKFVAVLRFEDLVELLKKAEGR
jgi:hypothetical protein